MNLKQQLKNIFAIYSKELPEKEAEQWWDVWRGVYCYLAIGFGLTAFCCWVIKLLLSLFTIDLSHLGWSFWITIIIMVILAYCSLIVNDRVREEFPKGRRRRDYLMYELIGMNSLLIGCFCTLFFRINTASYFLALMIMYLILTIQSIFLSRTPTTLGHVLQMLVVIVPWTALVIYFEWFSLNPILWIMLVGVQIYYTLRHSPKLRKAMTKTRLNNLDYTSLYITMMSYSAVLLTIFDLFSQTLSDSEE